MARIYNLKDYNTNRKEETWGASSDDFGDGDFEALKFENKQGDIMVVRPQEVKDVLKDYIKFQINEIADDITTNFGSKIKERLEFRLKQFEIGLMKHVDDKINKITEKVVENTMNRIIQNEVDRRINEKLKKLKEFL
jgi:hypothetical protein